MAAGIVEELAERIGARLWSVNHSVLKGIAYQAAPDYDPKSGRLLHGQTKHPFVSITHITPEQMPAEESTNVSAKVIRTFTVALVADKTIVEADPGVYADCRTKLMNSLHTYRWDGVIYSVPNCSIMQALVKPASPISQAAWQNSGKFISIFDVQIETDERPGLPS